MACTPIPGGGMMCARSVRTPNCGVPGCSNKCAFECDYPVKRKKSGTCDARLCQAHATELGPERHHCPPHAKLQSPLAP